MWIQRELTLRQRPRGFHLVTREVVDGLPELRDVSVGLLHLFIRHTSASLTLNENASADVRDDFETWFNEVVDEDFRGWTHTLEGPDDMPAHIKAIAARPVAEPAGRRRRPGAGHVAGRLPLRAPRPRRRALAGRDAAGRRALAGGRP
jgi:secondary thiamine-phosphate synthase enzyme